MKYTGFEKTKMPSTLHINLWNDLSVWGWLENAGFGWLRLWQSKPFKQKRLVAKIDKKKKLEF
jgi:hypothetical protein